MINIAPALTHINLMTQDMDRTNQFYGDVLGFTPGYRPPFPVPGCWMYLGENALIHLVETGAPVKNYDPAVNHFALTVLRKSLIQSHDQPKPDDLRM